MLEEGVKEKVVCSGLYETSNRCWKLKSNYRKREESHFRLLRHNMQGSWEDKILESKEMLLQIRLRRICKMQS